MTSSYRRVSHGVGNFLMDNVLCISENFTLCKSSIKANHCNNSSNCTSFVITVKRLRNIATQTGHIKICFFSIFAKSQHVCTVNCKKISSLWQSEFITKDPPPKRLQHQWNISVAWFFTVYWYDMNSGNFNSTYTTLSLP